MKERPILFSAPMVRAILEGRKTQTRRLVKLPADTSNVIVDQGGTALFGPGPYIKAYGPEQGGDAAMHPRIRCPYGYPGDRLWVRETHARFSVGEGMDRPVPECVAYRATCESDGSFGYVNTRGEIMGLKVTKWTPAIHMPRWASRITLEVTGVRVERLHAISEDDAKAEGVERDTEPCDHTRLSCEEIGCMGPTHRSAFASLWHEINGEESWDANPWVWVVSFKRAARPADVAARVQEQLS